MRFFDKLISWLYPHRCPVCGAFVREKGERCADCRKPFAENAEYVLPPLVSRKGLYCLRSPFLYRGQIRKGIMALKFSDHRDAALFFAGALSDLSQVSGLKEAQVVTAVPLSRKRKSVRGYNQSELIARQYALLKGLPYKELLIRKKDAPKQSLSQTKEERARNVSGCFEALPEAAGQTVVLIDDVYTTGATLSECAVTLRRAGASRVIGLTAAVAGKK